MSFDVRAMYPSLIISQGLDMAGAGEVQVAPRVFKALREERIRVGRKSPAGLAIKGLMNTATGRLSVAWGDFGDEGREVYETILHKGKEFL